MRPRITFANVVSVIALSVALGGTAIATHPGGANTISSGDIIDNVVRSEDIRDGNVTSADLRTDSVISGKIADGGIQGVDVKSDTLTGAHIDESALNGGGDVSGPLSDLQIAPGRIGRAELGISGSELGCCVFSDFEYSVPANGCHTKTLGLSEAKLGDIFIAFPESSDLGTGVYLRPTVVAHPGEIIFEICNTTGSPVTIPFGTFFKMRLID